MADEKVEGEQEPQKDPLLYALPYVVPYGIFGVLTYAADAFESYQSLLYIVKVFAVAAALWYYRKTYTEIKIRFSSATLVAALVGVAVIVVWIGLDRYYPQSSPEMTRFVREGTRFFEHEAKVEGQFNPFEESQGVPPIIAIIFRMIGAVLLVPIFEELLVRSWLMRYVIKEKFWLVPIGAFTHASFWVGVAAFGLTHHEWLAALICSAAFNWLLYWKKDFFLCIVAHAVANLALAIWVLTTGQWWFW